MLLSCSDLCKSFPEKTILQNASFHLEDHDKAALIGMNGAGKTTLLKIIIGEIPSDSGTVVFSQNATIGYLSQQHNVNTSLSIWDELLSVKSDIVTMQAEIQRMEASMSHYSGDELEQFMLKYHNLLDSFQKKNGYALNSEITGILKGLGFSPEDFTRGVQTLSGGQKTRLALAKILLLKPSLIILDEPTNHLDMHSIQFLENFLRSFQGAVLLVSHDRYFLDRTVNKVIEVENGVLSVFTGNYTEYSAKKEQLRIAAWNAYANQQRNIKHQEEVIAKLRSFNREKSIRRAESREKMIAKIELIDKPVVLEQKMKIKLVPHNISGNDVLTVKDLSKSFGDNHLFCDCNIEIKRGEHVALIGDNGTGKTTLLKMINNLIVPDHGTISIGANVCIGYYDQEYQVLDPENTLFEEISDAHPDMDNTSIRNMLAAFLFTNDDVFKFVGDLSGGEKGRLCLAKLMLSESNFLILDEPTNHLDIVSKEILENALNQYEGTCFFISHDRYFVNRTASRIIELEEHHFTNYLGNYDYYLEKKIEQSPTEKAKIVEKNTGAENWQKEKELQAMKRKRENDLKKTEEQITRFEELLKAIEDEMSLPENAVNVAKLNELTSRHEEICNELNNLYEKWEQLSE